MPSYSMNPKWWVLIAVGTGTFMSALDSSVVNTILPVIRDALESRVATVEWVVTIYLLIVSSLLLTFGRLGDLRGHKTIYVSGFVLFVTGSALCGMAHTAIFLICFRGIQAIGAAMLFSNSPAILTGNFPAEERGRALGLSATMTYLGLTIGPSLGGWLAQQLSWRAVFYINLPVGALALTLSLVFIPRDIPGEAGQKFDLIGAFTFMTGLVALMLTLNKGAEWGWVSIPILSSLGIAIVSMALFIAIEIHSPAPMLDTSLFRNPLFSASTANAVLNYICLYAIIFLMPFYLIQGRSLNPAQAGLFLTAQPIVMAVAAPISGTLSDRIGSRLPGMIGMTILGTGLFMLSRLGSQTSFEYVVASLAMTGLGTGIFISPNNSALMGSAPRHRQGIASGILASGRNVGMVLGIGMAGAILTTYLSGDSVGGLFSGIQKGFLAAILVAILGIITAAVKEK